MPSAPRHWLRVCRPWIVSSTAWLTFWIPNLRLAIVQVQRISERRLTFQFLPDVNFHFCWSSKRIPSAFLIAHSLNFHMFVAWWLSFSICCPPNLFFFVLSFSMAFNAFWFPSADRFLSLIGNSTPVIRNAAATWSYTAEKSRWNEAYDDVGSVRPHNWAYISCSRK